MREEYEADCDLFVQLVDAEIQVRITVVGWMGYGRSITGGYGRSIEWGGGGRWMRWVTVGVR